MNTRLENRLRRQRRENTKPTPVYITYDSEIMTSAQAIAAAERAGILPANAVLAIFPERAKDHQTWTRIVQREHAERERQRAAVQQSATPAGTDPAGPSTP